MKLRYWDKNATALLYLAKSLTLKISTSQNPKSYNEFMASNEQHALQN